jgi:sugar transferase (PEP-CTERM system associated)
MIRIFGFYILLPVLFIGMFDVSILSGLSLYLMPAIEPPLHANLPSRADDALLFTTAGLLLLYAMGLYRPKYLRGTASILLRLVIALAMTGAGALVALALFPGHAVSLAAAGTLLGASYVGLAAVRFAIRPVLTHRAIRTRILVVGTGARAAQVEKALSLIGPERCVCVGYFPVSGGVPKVAADQILRENDLAAVADKLAVDEVVVASEDLPLGQIAGSLRACRADGVDVIDVSNFLEREIGQVDANDPTAAWLLYSDGTTRFGLTPAAKRVLDIALSSFVLLLTLPVTLLTALAIWIEDRGPIFYAQERVGQNGRIFRVLKFRSMRTDAEKDGKARWASRNDPRVTLVGSFIRKVRIDEIPQVWNVLRNDMSFIGPRPERPSIVEDLMREFPTFGFRHLVKPGITGWAQVNYPYGASKEDSLEKLKFDLYYIKNGGLFLDLLIILQTLRVIIWPEGVH